MKIWVLYYDSMVVPNDSNIFRKMYTFYYYIILFIYFWVLFTFHLITDNVIDPFSLNVNVIQYFRHSDSTSAPMKTLWNGSTERKRPWNLMAMQKSIKQGHRHLLHLWRKIKYWTNFIVYFINLRNKNVTVWIVLLFSLSTVM